MAPGKAFRAKMAYFLRPPIEVCAKFDVPKGSTRTWGNGVQLGPAEFVADGEDKLGLVLFIHRADAPEDEPMREVQVEQYQIQFTGRDGERFELREDPDFEEPGQKRYELCSKEGRPLLASADVPERMKLALKARVRLQSTSSQGTVVIDLQGEAEVLPRCFFLKLIVVPGWKPGTSEAGAMVVLAPGGKPCQGSNLRLEVIAKGAAQLAVEGTPDQATDADGCARWVLRYGNLTWDTIAGAQVSFKVRCGIVGPGGAASEATYVELDVQENGAKLFAALDGAASSLELTNPEWQYSSSARTIPGLLWPDYLCGPLNNILDITTGSTFGNLAHYTCGMLRDRIWDWMLARRFSQDLEVRRSMNGFDFCKWEMAPIHVYFGLHPAGLPDDPRFVDPWWDQTYAPGTVLTQGDERMKMAGTLAASALLILVTRGILLRKGFAVFTSKLSIALLGGGAGGATGWSWYKGILHEGASPVTTQDQYMAANGDYPKEYFDSRMKVRVNPDWKPLLLQEAQKKARLVVEPVEPW